jgi:hypothetical protein
MRYNLYWLAIKQFRLSYWLYEKLFYLGLALHVRRKYGKWNPSVLDIIQGQGHAPRYVPDLLKYEEYGWQPDGHPIRDDAVLMRAGGEEMPIESRIKAGLTIAKDLIDGKMDFDPALFDHYFGKLQADFEQIKKEIK